jgi:hypothetical protein
MGRVALSVRAWMVEFRGILLKRVLSEDRSGCGHAGVDVRTCLMTVTCG